MIENVPRIIPNGLSAVVEKSNVNVPSLMKELMKRGGIEENEMFGTFNMGVGMVVICDESNAQNILNLIEGSMLIGTIEKGDEKITLR